LDKPTCWAVAFTRRSAVSLTGTPLSAEMVFASSDD
jgi:hypothetical protein